jgi:ribonuclease HI
MITIYIDGASRGNPGKSSCAFVIEKNGKIIDEKSFFLGVITNNQAEYKGLIHALRRAVELNEKNVILYSDSELLVKQLQGYYQVKSENLKPLFEEYTILRKRIESFDVVHIPREKNKRADMLCNQELNRSVS